MKQQRGLGRGLNALLSNEAMHVADNKDAVKMVNINEVEPNSEQPRKSFNEKELEELRQSIKEHGIIQPIIVREKNNKYEIVAGERRYRAARLAELQEIPILVRQFSDQETLEIALVENIQRQELNPMELAYAYHVLMEEFNLSQEEVAVKVGKSRSGVANLVRLLKLDPYVQEKLRMGELSFGHARALLAIDDITMQKKLADIIIEKQMSVREIEKYIQALTPKKKAEKEESLSNPFYREIQENLQQLLGTKVTISKGQKKGKIEIEYYSDDELERIIQMISLT